MIGFAFDGTGYGDDGAVWGGEIMIADYRGYRRVGHFATPRCRAATPASAIRAGWRCPICGGRRGLGRRLPSVAACTDVERPCWPASWRPAELACRPRAWAGCSTRCPRSPGSCHRIAYEAEAAMRFEGLARAGDRAVRPGVSVRAARHDGTAMIADPTPVIRAVARRRARAGRRPR